MKIRQLGAELFMRTDGHDETNSRFSQFCEIEPQPQNKTVTIFTTHVQLMLIVYVKQSIFVCIEDFEKWAVLGNYITSSGNSLPTFRYVGKELPLLAA